MSSDAVDSSTQPAAPRSLEQQSDPTGPRNTVVVIDYGMGNLKSIANALSVLGTDVVVSASAADVRRADRLVLPGVGAFGESMRELADRSLIEPIRSAVGSGTPFLGICLGFQVLFGDSNEHDFTKGLGLFDGHVRRFDDAATDDNARPLTIPHMGWNRLLMTAAGTAHHLTRGLPEAPYVYFVHSYRPEAVLPEVVLATCDYGGLFACIVARKNLAGTQFHPEKSGTIGLQILKNFTSWAP